MITAKAPVVAVSEAEAQSAYPAAVGVSPEPLTYTPCASYREASDLAARRRYEGRDASATFHVAMDCWSVRGVRDPAD
jgi:hypothetical protein